MQLMNRMNQTMIFRWVFVLGVLLGNVVGAQEAGESASKPVIVSLKIFVVEQAADGTESFVEAATARAGETVEYRLLVSHVGIADLDAGTVVVTAPVPVGTTYVAGSATPSSDMVLLEYTGDVVDNLSGARFSEAPVFVDMVNEQGETVREIAAPESYTAVRWTFLLPFLVKGEESLVYRVVVE